MERAAIEYNQMQHLVKRGKDLAFVKENEWRITRIKETLEQKLLKTLSTALLQVRAGELTRSTKQSLIQCLRTYSLIDQTETGERIIREQFVRLYLEKIIQPKVLLNSQDAHPLAEMYKKIISFVEVDLQPILDITQKTLKGSNYEVLVNSLWVEISYRISQECKMIFAPGQTSVFHKVFFFLKKKYTHIHIAWIALTFLHIELHDNSFISISFRGLMQLKKINSLPSKSLILH